MVGTLRNDCCSTTASRRCACQVVADLADRSRRRRGGSGRSTASDRRRRTARRAGRGRMSCVVAGEQQQQLGLQRIGVLELVHQDEAEALLERRAGPARSRGRGRGRGSAGRESPARRSAACAPRSRATQSCSSACTQAARSASATFAERANAVDQRRRARRAVACRVDGLRVHRAAALALAAGRDRRPAWRAAPPSPS